MSDDNGQEERYVVRSLTGYPINPSEAHYVRSSDAGRKSTEWIVMDTYNCYRVVASYCAKNAEHRARMVAKLRNREERLWELRYARS